MELRSKVPGITSSTHAPADPVEGDIWLDPKGFVSSFINGSWHHIINVYLEKEEDNSRGGVYTEEEVKEFHVEPVHKKDTVENTVVKQNVFQEALDKIITSVKIKLPSKD